MKIKRKEKRAETPGQSNREQEAKKCNQERESNFEKNNLSNNRKRGKRVKEIEKEK